LPDQSYQTGWGLYDDTLFIAATEKFHELSGNDQPFGLFLLTLDTHHPNGHPSKRCSGKEYRDGSNPILNAVACTDYLVGSFISDILNSEHAKNTIIVIASDHLAMRNTATSMLSELERNNLFIVISPDNNVPREISKAGSLLDVAPTILSAMDYEAELGLGRNLFSDEDTLTSSFSDIDNVLSGWRNNLMDFWGFPTLGIDDHIEIDNMNDTVTLKGRTFKYPLLIEFGDNNHTIIRFKLHRKKVKLIEHRLIDYVGNIEENKAFLWLDSCKDIRPASTGLWESNCVLYGRAGSDNIIFEQLVGNTVIPVNSIRGIN